MPYDDIDQLLEQYGITNRLDLPNSSQMPSGSNNFNSPQATTMPKMKSLLPEGSDSDSNSDKLNKSIFNLMSGLKPSPAQQQQLFKMGNPTVQQVQIPSNIANSPQLVDIQKELSMFQNQPQNFAHGGLVLPKFSKLKNLMKK